MGWRRPLLAASHRCPSSIFLTSRGSLSRPVLRVVGGGAPACALASCRGKKRKLLPVPDVVAVMRMRDTCRHWWLASSACGRSGGVYGERSTGRQSAAPWDAASAAAATDVDFGAPPPALPFSPHTWDHLFVSSRNLFPPTDEARQAVR